MFHPVWFRNAATTASLITATITGTVFAAPQVTAATATEAQVMQLAQAAPQASEEVPLNDRLAVLGIALAGSAALGMTLTAIQGGKPAGSSRPVRLTAGRAGGRADSTVSLNRVNPRLKRKLLRLLHDQPAVADRLLHQAQLKYPGQTPDWYGEKVIYDIQRDHGRV